MIGQARLQALDFWMRNPDYFADELLNEVDSGRMDSIGIDLALGILDSDEPDLRRYPMVAGCSAHTNRSTMLSPCCVQTD
jgi:hypothetical protein